MVFDNDLSYNGYYGVVCDYTNDSEISENTISYNNDGIALAESSNNLIDDKSISDNDESGIVIGYNSNYISITNNKLYSNLYCILIGESCQGTQLSNNGDCQTFSFDDTSPSSEDQNDDDNYFDDLPTISGFLPISLVMIFSITILILTLKQKKKISKKNKNSLKQ